MQQEDWYELLGRIASSQRSENYAENLAKALRSIADFEYCVIFAYCQDATPVCLYDDFPPVKQKIHVEDYQAGPYLLDPFFLAATSGVAAGLYRMKEVAPDRFYQGEYFRNYYQATYLAEEIGIFVPVEDVMIVVSLMRTEKVFSAVAIRKLKEVVPFFTHSITAHWHDARTHFQEVNNGQDGSRISQIMYEVFHENDQYALTARELEVVEYTLKGYSAEAAGNVMQISTGTVRIHKRNIYAKLRISSQGELFSIFFNALTKAR